MAARLAHWSCPVCKKDWKAVAASTARGWEAEGKCPGSLRGRCSVADGGGGSIAGRLRVDCGSPRAVRARESGGAEPPSEEAFSGSALHILEATNSLWLVLDLIGVDDTLCTALVCRAFRDALNSRAGGARLQTGVGAVAASISRIAWMMSEPSKPEWLTAWDPMTCSRIARAGKLPALEWARARGCDWDISTCSSAARGGHLDVLKWARRNGCGWGAGTCLAAAANGHLELLQVSLPPPPSPPRANHTRTPPRPLLVLVLDCTASRLPAEDFCQHANSEPGSAAVGAGPVTGRRPGRAVRLGRADLSDGGTGRASRCAGLGRDQRLRLGRGYLQRGGGGRAFGGAGIRPGEWLQLECRHLCDGGDGWALGGAAGVLKIRRTPLAYSLFLFDSIATMEAPGQHALTRSSTS